MKKKEEEELSKNANSDASMRMIELKLEPEQPPQCLHGIEFEAISKVPFKPPQNMQNVF